MAYIRKTEDEWHIEGNYGPRYGWETVTVETSRPEAFKRLREYNEAEPKYEHRIVKRRVRKEAA